LEALNHIYFSSPVFIGVHYRIDVGVSDLELPAVAKVPCWATDVFASVVLPDAKLPDEHGAIHFQEITGRDFDK
jgi:hypothetical protein